MTDRSSGKGSDTPFVAEQVRKDFPLLENYGGVYLDNAATAQKPKVVLDTLQHYYQQYNANVHRSSHTLSHQATEAFEAARSKVQRFINAPTRESVIFTKGTTEAINLVAGSWGADVLKPKDVILLTEMEHHSNIVPWQLLAKQTGATIKVVPVTSSGELNLEVLDRLLSEQVKLLAITHISNALGTINPIAEIIEQAHSLGALVLVDGAQGAVHARVDVQALDCDFYAFSGHKLFGPTGIGVLYGKVDLLEAMPPWQGGGEMIEQVSFEGSSWNQLPYKFEAGTPNIAGAIGLGSAIDYLNGLDWVAIMEHEKQLVQRAVSGFKQMDGISLIGEAEHRAGIVSFVPAVGHAHDIGTLINEQQVAIRTGHHCAMPLMSALGISGTARASFCFYNTQTEVDQLLQAVSKACTFFN